MLHGCRQLYSLIKTEDIYVDIVKDVCTKTLQQDSILQIMNIDKSFPKPQSKKFILLMKHELGGEK